MKIAALKSTNSKDERSPIHPDTISMLLNLGGEIVFEADIGNGINVNNKVFEELNRLFSIIGPIASKYGVSIQLDPTYQSQYDLYTGLFFQLIYKDNFSPKVLARGGRYDGLLKSLGSKKNISAVGAAINLNNLKTWKI